MKKIDNSLFSFRESKVALKDVWNNIFLFKRPLFFLFFLMIYCYSVYLLLPVNVGFGLLLVTGYFVFSHKVTELFIMRLYTYLSLSRDPNKLTAVLGFVDRLIYALCFAFHEYNFIGLWLSIKIAQRLVQFEPIKLIDNEGAKDIGERKNVFLIGNLISLLLGIIGGYLIQFLFNLPLSRFPRLI